MRAEFSTGLDDWVAAGRYFDFEGQPVFYRIEGEGAGLPLVLLHGFPTASWDWQRVWPALVEHCGPVIAPDFLGYGLSAKPDAPVYSIARQADLIEALMAELGQSAMHLLAHDYGDTVAQELLARRHEGRGVRIESVCLLNGGLFPETHRARPVQRLLASRAGPLLTRAMTRRSFGASLAGVFGRQTQPQAAELDDFWALAKHHDGLRVYPRLIRYMQERRIHRERWVNALQRCTVPLRLVAGLADPVSGAHMVDRYRELVPDADVVALPTIGHYPQWEAPDAVLQAYRSFRAAASAAGSSAP